MDEEEREARDETWVVERQKGQYMCIRCNA
jgi:hypothetical protein